jgi:biotin transport system substrate-specific component
MNTKDTVYIALFAALVAALGIIPPVTLPVVGVPITAQSMGVMMAGGILGARRGALSMILFLVLVGAGLPLLSGGRGGFSVFLGPSGGFLLGWVVAAFVVGFITERVWDRLNIVSAVFAAFIGGVVVLYALGIPWVAFAADISLSKAFFGSMGFVPGDALKAVITGVVMVTVKNAYPLISARA